MLNRLLVTGAAGGVGQVIRPHLTKLARQVRLTDIADLGDAAAHEEIVTCDLADADAVAALVSDCDGIGYGPMPFAAQRRSSGPQIAEGSDFDVFTGEPLA